MTDLRPPRSDSTVKSAFSTWKGLYTGGVCLVVALGVHWVVLSLKLPQQTQSASNPKEEDISEDSMGGISVTVFPSVSPTPASPSPEPSTGKPLQPTVMPKSTEPPAQPLPVPTASPAEVVVPSQSETVENLEAETSEPIPEPEGLQQEAEEEEPDPYADFPHSVDTVEARDACEGCWHNPNSNFRSMNLKEQLENQGYTLRDITGEMLDTDIGVRVYAVRKGEEITYYLNLVQVLNGGVLYTMTDEPIASEKIEDLQQY